MMSHVFPEQFKGAGKVEATASGMTQPWKSGIVISAIGYTGPSAQLTEGGASTEHEDHRQGSLGASLESGCQPSPPSLF